MVSSYGIHMLLYLAKFQMNPNNDIKIIILAHMNSMCSYPYLARITDLYIHLPYKFHTYACEYTYPYYMPI